MTSSTSVLITPRDTRSLIPRGRPVGLPLCPFGKRPRWSRSGWLGGVVKEHASFKGEGEALVGPGDRLAKLFGPPPSAECGTAASGTGPPLPAVSRNIHDFSEWQVNCAGVVARR